MILSSYFFAGLAATAAILFISNFFIVHLLLSIAVMSLYTIAAAQALVWMWVERCARYNPSLLMHYAIPSLESLEKLLFRSLEIGFVLLSVLLVSSLPYFSHDVMMLPVKWLLAGGTWLLFLFLLLGRFFLGWRGKFLIRWMALGIGVLMLLTLLSSFHIVI